MIPASFLFKDAYHQAWEYQDVTPSLRPVPADRAGFIDGLLSPTAGAISALLHRAARASHHGHFAHD